MMHKEKRLPLIHSVGAESGQSLLIKHKHSINDYALKFNDFYTCAVISSLSRIKRRKEQN